MSRGIAIFGATSAIAQSLARQCVTEGARFFLVGRSEERLAAIAADLQVRGAAHVTIAIADFENTSCRLLCTTAKETLGTIEIALVAHGELSDQPACEQDETRLHATMNVNLVSHAQLLLGLASILEQQRCGTLVAMGSVAGDRGKGSNYVYGCAKAGIAVLQQGLMARLQGTGAHALLVKPGFVDTPMTSGFKKGLLWMGPDRVASAILQAIQGQRTTIYVPFFWRIIMTVLRALPDRVFVRLKL